MSSRKYNRKASLIAVLDILGISSMMNNAQPDDLSNLAQSLEEAFNEAQTNAQRIISEIDKRHNKKFSIKRFFEIQVFSDTITICCNFNKIIKEIPILERIKLPEYYLMIYGFFVCVKEIAYSLFINGYPTRGCISAGPIISTKNFIVGKPFIESITISNNLNFAGVVVSKKAKLVYDNISEGFQSLLKDAPIERHLVACKNVRKQQMWCLNFLDGPNDRFLITDIASIFSEHGKNITGNVQEKITNTQNLLQSFLKRRKNTSVRLSIARANADI